jgi:hypothetical protein
MKAKSILSRVGNWNKAWLMRCLVEAIAALVQAEVEAGLSLQALAMSKLFYREPSRRC